MTIVFMSQKMYYEFYSLNVIDSLSTEQVIYLWMGKVNLEGCREKQTLPKKYYPCICQEE
jgi:hypothetical protein